MNPNVNDFNNTNTQPLNHQFIDYNAHANINHTNPFPNQNQSPNINFSADANYAPPASNMNQNFQPQQQAQFQVNQGFQTGFPNTTMQMNTGPQVTFGTQVVQQPGIQVVTQPGYAVTTQPSHNVVVVNNGYGGNLINTTVTAGQHAVKWIFLFFFFFIFFFVFMMSMLRF